MMTDAGPLRPYRHRTGSCSRLLFEGYLPPGTHIRVRCPACGGMHLISIPIAGLNGTNGHSNGTNGHVRLTSTGILDTFADNV